MTSRRSVWFVSFTIICTLLAGCTHVSTENNQNYSRREVRGEQSVRFATVDSVRNVQITEQDPSTGGLAGGIIGGVAGSNLGQGRGAIVGTVLGAVLGSFAGKRLEQQAGQNVGLEITVRLDDGRFVAIVQGNEEAFRPGERVRLLSHQGITRVTH